MKSIKRILQWPLFGMAAIFMIGCSGADNNQEASPTVAPTSGVENFGPSIHCKLDQTGASDTRVLSSIAGEQSPFSNNPVAGSQVAIDCTGTSDESSFDKLSFEIDTQYDATNPKFRPFDGAGDMIDMSFAGQNSVAFRVTDDEGATSIINPNIVVDCVDKANPTFLASEVSVVNMGYNLFTYTIPASATPGTTDRLLYSFDVDGDGKYEDVPNGNYGIWSSNTATTIYSMYVGNEVPSIKVWNSCSDDPMEYPLTGAFNFSGQTFNSVVARDADSLATLQSFEYNQVDLSSNDSDERLNGDTLLTWSGGSPRYVQCTLSKKKDSSGAETIGFSLVSTNEYDGNETHGYDFKAVLNASPDATTGEYEGWSSTYDSAQGAQGPGIASMSKFNFTSDGSGDSLTSHTYSVAGSNCQLHMTLKFNTGRTPCQSGENPSSHLMLLEGGDAYGEYVCPGLTSGSNLGVSVDADNGKFACSFNPANRCVGGGGGGGGIQPILE